MFVKICGITTPDDARVAVAAGADSIGLNFTATSRRRITVEQARAIVEVVPGGVLVVGVFRDQLADEVIETVEAAGLGAAQLHGRETVSTSRRVHARVPLLFRAMDAADPSLAGIDDHRADVLLLDAPVPGGGVPFDWSLVDDLTTRHRVLLAGGLRPGNVAEAIATVRPWGVDVASGVEAAPGRKDPEAVRTFVAVARAAAEGHVSPHGPLVVDRNPA